MSWGLPFIPASLVRPFWVGALLDCVMNPREGLV